MIPRRAYLKRTPVKRRRTGPPRRSSRVHDPKRLAWLRGLPCWACYREVYAFMERFECADEILRTICGNSTHAGRQGSHTEAAHIGLSTSVRGLSQKFSDAEAIPLCHDEHHQLGPESIHKMLPEAFFAAHQADRDQVVRMFQKIWKDSRC